MSSISTTIIGSARVVDAGSAEEQWCKEKHLENNTFASEESSLFTARQSSGAPNNNRYNNNNNDNDDEDEDDAGQAQISVDDSARVVAVEVREGRIADWKGGVRDWTVVPEPEPEPEATRTSGQIEESAVGESRNQSNNSLTNHATA